MSERSEESINSQDYPPSAPAPSGTPSSPFTLLRRFMDPNYSPGCTITATSLRHFFDACFVFDFPMRVGDGGCVAPSHYTADHIPARLGKLSLHVVQRKIYANNFASKVCADTRAVGASLVSLALKL